MKAALPLSHSNAIPECRFSVNNILLGKESLSLSAKTNAVARTARDTNRIFGSVTEVNINKDFIDAAKKAHFQYQVYLEEHCKQEEIVLQKKIDLEKQYRIKEEMYRRRRIILQCTGKRRKEIGSGANE